MMIPKSFILSLPPVVVPVLTVSLNILLSSWKNSRKDSSGKRSPIHSKSLFFMNNDHDSSWKNIQDSPNWTSISPDFLKIQIHQSPRETDLSHKKKRRRKKLNQILRQNTPIHFIKPSNQINNTVTKTISHTTATGASPFKTQTCGAPDNATEPLVKTSQPDRQPQSSVKLKPSMQTKTLTNTNFASRPTHAVSSCSLQSLDSIVEHPFVKPRERKKGFLRESIPNGVPKSFHSNHRSRVTSGKHVQDFLNWPSISADLIKIQTHQSPSETDLSHKKGRTSTRSHLNVWSNGPTFGLSVSDRWPQADAQTHWGSTIYPQTTCKNSCESSASSSSKTPGKERKSNRVHVRDPVLPPQSTFLHPRNLCAESRQNINHRQPVTTTKRDAATWSNSKSKWRKRIQQDQSYCNAWVDQ